MATYRQVYYGSTGDEVKQLQTALNSKGYSLDVDGNFGSKTQAAVRDYQSKNNLTVDGVAGDQTWGSLLGSGGTTKASAGTGGSSTPAKALQLTGVSDSTNAKLSQYAQYKPSDAVTAAQQKLQAAEAQKPGAFTSEYDAKLQDIYEKIMNRDKFSYDLNGDMLYQQYRDQYTNLGKQAMMDTMGQAAALTGGYGSTYSQSAGQQAYNAYLQSLNDVVPELYDRARSRYDAETDELYKQYSMAGEGYNRDYDRYRDAVSDYNTDYNRLYNAYTDERNYDYGKYQNDLNYWLDVAQLENSDYWTRYNAALAAASSGGSSGGSGGGGYYSGDYSDALSSGKYKRTEAQDLAQVNKMDAYATGKVTSNYYAKNLTYDSVANSVAAAGNSEKANLLTENGYNLLKKRGVMSGYSSYQAYLANVLKNYGA